MSELVKKILKEIGKFEVGINELRAFSRKDVYSYQEVLNAYDLLFRYGFTGGQLIALLTTNSRSGLETAEILAVGEAGKLATHYMFKGIDYMTNLAMKINRIFQSYDRQTTLNLNKR